MNLATALRTGVPPDGGLYHPRTLPPFPPGFLEEIRGDTRRRGADPVRTGTMVLHHLLGQDGGMDSGTLEGVSREALTFPIPLVRLQGNDFLLELFHGPTLAFKDVGARVMAGLLSALERDSEGQSRTILTATSGDTGGAVASAFQHHEKIRTFVLFPRDGVSREQRLQFTTAGPNIHALAVEGSFDDCQHLIREAFASPLLRRRHRLTSANSLNAGRLLPQVIYYVHGWAQLPSGEGPPLFSVPSGNLGNLTAGLMAHVMGLPAAGFIGATNANRCLVDFLETGRVAPRPSQPTLSSAMDVGDPSNLRRILALYSPSGEGVSLTDPHGLERVRQRLRSVLSASSWSDDQTARCIRQVMAETDRMVDPHTAVGILALDAARAEAEWTGTSGNAPEAMPASRGGVMEDVPGVKEAPGVVLATAHPAKFRATMEEVLRQSVSLPASLESQLHLEERIQRLDPTLSALARILDQS